jgi:hypothetical protein
VTKSIGEAFKLLKMKTDERKDNPFASVFAERDTVPSQLFRCQVHRKDVVPDKVIGAGQFGQVYLAMYKETQKVAVKTVRLAASENDKADFVGEADVMRRLVCQLCLRSNTNASSSSPLSSSSSSPSSLSLTFVLFFLRRGAGSGMVCPGA